MPPPASSAAVPPVDTISTPSPASPRAKSTSPRLSETLSRARRIRTSPGALTFVLPDSIAIVDLHRSRVGRVGTHAPGGYQAHGTRQQPVLDAVHSLLDLGDPRRIRKLEGLLKDDRTRVHPFVDEMHGHAGLARPGLDGSLDGPKARERRQQGRMYVHDPAGKPPDEPGREQLHEPREHDQVDAERVEPVAQRP